MKTYVISLAGSARRDQCRLQLGGAEIEFDFFDAVDGPARSVETDHLYDSVENKRKFKRPLSAEEIGCYLSHLQVWKKVAESGMSALVLEDDFMMHHETKAFVASIPAEILQNSVIKICGAKRHRWKGGTIHVSKGRQIRRYHIVSPHTTGYVIGPVAAARLLAVRERFFRPVDIDLKHVWEHGVAVYGVDPPLVGERGLQQSSTIAAGREGMKPTSSLQRFLANLRYQARFLASSLMHRQANVKIDFSDDGGVSSE